MATLWGHEYVKTKFGWMNLKSVLCVYFQVVNIQKYRCKKST